MTYFEGERWDGISKIYDEWWAGNNRRPIAGIKVSTGGERETGVRLSQHNCTDLSVSPKDLILAEDTYLSSFRYLGDAFPFFNLDVFGPGVLAAFLGAELDNSSGNVWFHPKEILPARELHFKFDRSSMWYQRVLDICYAGLEYWKGGVLIGMPDLGGVLDVLASFRTTEGLLFDLYDEPDEIKRLTHEIQTAWFEAYNGINALLSQANPGCGDWSEIYSQAPSYILQSDFSYMISADMFDEFVADELKSTSERLSNAMFHLDGVGELKHLDSLLKIESIKAVQWIPGDGQLPLDQWEDVYKRIAAAGKRIQIWGCVLLPKIADQIGDARLLQCKTVEIPPDKEMETRRILEEYNVL